MPDKPPPERVSARAPSVLPDDIVRVWSQRGKVLVIFGAGFALGGLVSCACRPTISVTLQQLTPVPAAAPPDASLASPGWRGVP